MVSSGCNLHSILRDPRQTKDSKKATEYVYCHRTWAQKRLFVVSSCFSFLSLPVIR